MKRPQQTKSVFIVGDDVGILRIIDQHVLRSGGAAYKNDVVRLAAIGDFHKPGGATPGVTWSESCDHCHPAEVNLIFVLEKAVSPNRLISQRVSPLKIAFAAIGNCSGIRLAQHELSTGQPLELGQAPRVIVVSVTID